MFKLILTYIGIFIIAIAVVVVAVITGPAILEALGAISLALVNYATAIVFILFLINDIFEYLNDNNIV